MKVYIDNFFTSPALFTNIYENYDTMLVEPSIKTVEVPKMILQQKNNKNWVSMKKISHFKKKGTFSCCVERIKIVSAISTIHYDAITEVDEHVVLSNRS